uniref:Uncharacterized protein n=1 Tax=Glossina pallidipes TaxID=7398 RepID=A0A1B0A5C1_GLOPL
MSSRIRLDSIIIDSSLFNSRMKSTTDKTKEAYCRSISHQSHANLANNEYPRRSGHPPLITHSGIDVSLLIKWQDSLKLRIIRINKNNNDKELNSFKNHNMANDDGVVITVVVDIVFEILSVYM